MTEYNIFCYSEKYNDKDSFQQKRWRAFNKEVGEGRYNEIKEKIREILGDNLKLELNKKDWSECWEKVTNEQWRQLLAIPEARDFKEGFEYITGIKINLEKKHKITIDGKEIEISDESYKNLKKSLS